MPTAWGGPGNDTIDISSDWNWDVYEAHGLGGDDTIIGSGQRSEDLWGDDGDDVIYDGNGGVTWYEDEYDNDTLSGGEGNDHLIHVWGGRYVDQDYLSGGKGDDVLTFSSFAGGTADGASGIDVLDINLTNTFPLWDLYTPGPIELIFDPYVFHLGYGDANVGTFRNMDRLWVQIYAESGLTIRGSGLDDRFTIYMEGGATPLSGTNLDARGGTDLLWLLYGDENEVTANLHIDVGSQTYLQSGAALNWTGFEQLEMLSGVGNDRLGGGALVDRLGGGLGNDIVEGRGGADRLNGHGGIDTVSYASSPGAVTVNLLTRATSGSDAAGDVITAFENVTGSAFADFLTGDAGSNVLDGRAGEDWLDGGEGADVLWGGAGNDRYIVDNTGDLVVENAGDGNDTIESSVSFSLAGQYVEILMLTGTADLEATGNGQANVLIGNAGANRLDGRGGADDLRGGAGDDLYIVDDSGDRITEASDAGQDVVWSAASFSLAGQYVEELHLTGTAAINGSGNSLANVITGNGMANTLLGAGGDDRLDGGYGGDVLAGGAGDDWFIFSDALHPLHIDAITDFGNGDDRIVLDPAIFEALAAGMLSADAFRAGTVALDADDHILYDAATGNIRYDPDGTGSYSDVLFARVTAGTVLTNADFFIAPP